MIDESPSAAGACGELQCTTTQFPVDTGGVYGVSVRPDSKLQQPFIQYHVSWSLSGYTDSRPSLRPSVPLILFTTIPVRTR